MCPISHKAVITSNEACDGSVATSILQDWLMDKPLFAMPQPMQFDDPLVQEHCQREIEEAWKFIGEQTGAAFDWNQLVKRLESQNELQRFEWEKWDVAANTDFYPINGVSQALYRIYQSQYGDLPAGTRWTRRSARSWRSAWSSASTASPDPPPGHRLVLRTPVLLQLVHLGL